MKEEKLHKSTVNLILNFEKISHSHKSHTKCFLSDFCSIDRFGKYSFHDPQNSLRFFLLSESGFPPIPSKAAVRPAGHQLVFPTSFMDPKSSP